ncbi:hypothetical protein BCR35DRAFT_304481 [Leucosporidium creatinivorum]|uniref:F-box domain-containing protein n=1 Tax=Leucosporidium creatinivorum TaxID=106004 RepID=A0A1Y2F8T6_9BASI|nr:hypothetical protein BCR35DRAFT_304481 [Leucosporidium creatinivorum]
MSRPIPLTTASTSLAASSSLSAAPRSSARPSSPNLPNEIIGMIINEVGARGSSLEKGRQRRTLARLCLVSKSALHFARPHLYRKIMMKQDRRDYESDGFDVCSRLHFPVVVTNPSLAALVRSIHIDAHRDSALVPMFVEVLLGVCPAADTLNATLNHGRNEDPSRANAEELQRVIRAGGRRLRRAILWNTEGWFEPGFSAMLAALDSMEELVLFVRGDPPLISPDAPPPTFRLRKLHLEYDTHDVSFLLHLLASSSTTLQIFNVACLTEHINLSPFGQLTQVEIYCQAPEEDGIPIFSTLATIPNLEHLTIPNQNDFEDITLIEFDCRPLDEARVLHHLSPSLKSLRETEWLSLSSHYILEVLRDPSVLPNLQELEVGFRVCAGNTTPYFSGRSMPEVEGIRLAAEARGVRVLQGGRSSWEELIAWDGEGSIIDD